MIRGAVVLLGLLASVASANVGKRQLGGEPTGEPVGITEIAIAREELVIDLRPVADDMRAKIRATYHLDNRGAEKPLDLVFASGSPSSGFGITLDGAQLPSRSVDTAMPESWKPPGATPKIGGGELGYETDARTLPIGFSMVIPPGKHDLVVSYGAEVVTYRAGEPTVMYQLAYVLSPAKTWAAFGGLDVTVQVPADWRLASAPALTRDGDTLRGTFATVPADALALTLSAPLGMYSIVRILVLVLFAAVALGGLFVVVWRTRVYERHCFAEKKVSSGTMWGLLRGLAWAGAFLVSGLLAVLGPDLTLPSGQADHHGYGQAFAIVGVVLGSLLVLVVGSIASIIVGRRVHAHAQT